MAKPILVANWKNNPDSLAEASRIIRELGKKRTLYKKTSFFIAPPLTYLETVARGSRSYAKLCVQDLGVSLPILKSFGTSVAILGHSDMRALGETDKQVSDKVKIALKAGITPLVCVGEGVRDHDGEHFEFLRKQIKNSLENISKNEATKIALAYEPVWAIGSKSKGAIEAKDLAEAVLFIRKVLSDLYGRAVADKIPVLYGGSVDVNNAESLYHDTGVRGFLIGRASLNPKALASIAESIL